MPRPEWLPCLSKLLLIYLHMSALDVLKIVAGSFWHIALGVSRFSAHGFSWICMNLSHLCVRPGNLDKLPHGLIFTSSGFKSTLPKQPYPYVYIYIYSDTYIYMCICTYIHTYTYLCIYTCISIADNWMIWLSTSTNLHLVGTLRSLVCTQGDGELSHLSQWGLVTLTQLTRFIPFHPVSIELKGKLWTETPDVEMCFAYCTIAAVSRKLQELVWANGGPKPEFFFAYKVI